MALIREDRDEGDFTVNIVGFGGERIIRESVDHACEARFSPDSKKVVTISDFRTTRLLNLETSKSSIFTTVGRYNSAEFDPQSARVIIACIDNTAKIFDCQTLALITTLNHDGPVKSARYSADGAKIVTASADRRVKIWDAQTGTAIDSIMHGAAVNTAQFSPDCKKVVTGADDSSAKIYDIDTRNVITLMHEHAPHSVRDTPNEVNSVVFSPDSKKVATISLEGIVKIIDVESGLVLSTIVHPHPFGIKVEFSPDSSKVSALATYMTAKNQTATIVGLPSDSDELIKELQLKCKLAKPGQKTCASCNKKLEAVKRCGACKVTTYCSQKCQATDWPAHKLNCKKPA